jgi:hypothetical protein
MKNLENKIEKTTSESDTQELQLQADEIQQIREMLKRSEQREKQTATSSIDSFWKWLQRIGILLTYVERIKFLPWRDIKRILQPVFDTINAVNYQF